MLWQGGVNMASAETIKPTGVVDKVRQAVSGKKTSQKINAVEEKAKKLKAAKEQMAAEHKKQTEKNTSEEDKKKAEAMDKRVELLKAQKEEQTKKKK